MQPLGRSQRAVTCQMVDLRVPAQVMKLWSRVGSPSHGSGAVPTGMWGGRHPFAPPPVKPFVAACAVCW